MRLLRSSSPLLVLLATCGGDADIEGGLNDAECSDGLDNDQNGRSDCEDPTCAQALACRRSSEDDTGGDDTGGDDTGDWDGGESRLIYATADCDAQGYFYEVKISGQGVGPELYILDTVSQDPWVEVHLFPHDPVEEDQNGQWEIYYLETDSVRNIGDVVEGETTLFQCDEHKNLTWLVLVFAENGDPVECAVWGDSPELANEFWGSACPEI